MGFFDSLIGGLGKVVDSGVSIWNADKNRHIQEEQLRHGIQNKVADARAAGIHPLFALGANTMSPSPVSVGTDFGGAGQDLSRAIASNASAPERALQLEGIKADVEGKHLQNDILKAKLASAAALVRNGAGPPKPVDVAGNKMSTTAVAGGVVVPNPNFSDAQVVQNRYGDLVEDVHGIGNVFADGYHTAVTKGIPAYHKAWTEPVSRAIMNIGSYYVSHPVF